MSNHADSYSSTADEIMKVLWGVVPDDECELGEALVGLCRQADELRRSSRCDCAIECCETGQRIARQIHNSTSPVLSRFWEGFFLMQLGAICLTRRKLAPAIECFRQANAQFQGCNRRRCQSVARMAIGESHRLAKDWEKALNAFQQSLNILKRLRPTDRSTIELQERVEQKLDQAQSEFIASIKSRKPKDPPAETDVPPTSTSWLIPIVGTIAAGAGVIAKQNIEGSLLLSQEHAHNADFAVHVRGQSMIEASILERDLALIRRQPVVENGTIAAILIPSEGQTLGTLKHYHRESDHHRLEPRNLSELTIVVVPMQKDVDKVSALYKRRGKQIKIHVGEARVIGKLVGVFRELD